MEETVKTPEVMGVEETKDILKLTIGIVNAGIEAKKNDGKFSWSDLTLLGKVVPMVGPAIVDCGKVIPEMKDLTEEEAAVLVSFTMAELNVEEGKAKHIVEHSLKVCIAVYGLVTAILE